VHARRVIDGGIEEFGLVGLPEGVHQLAKDLE
jgi:hypothetical protein